MARVPITLVDTSAAVAFVVSDHAAHDSTWDSLAERRLGLAGHAWFEAFSVLTRLPGARRRDADVVAELLTINFPESRFLDEATAATLGPDLARLGVSGGAVYDALVASAAAYHHLPLATRDRRAIDTYRAVGVEFELLD